MSSLDNMLRAMNATHSYSLELGDLVYREVQTYSECFDEISAEIGRAIWECFVGTAEDEGLTEYEKLVGAPRTELDNTTRRRMLKTMFSLGKNDYTKEGMLRFFESIDFPCSITEDPGFYHLRIFAQRRNYSSSEKAYIQKRAEAFIPCHLTFEIDYRAINWDGYEALNYTFDNWDSLNYTWDQLDNYEGEQ